jgi:hypothetical protein
LKQKPVTNELSPVVGDDTWHHLDN